MRKRMPSTATPPMTPPTMTPTLGEEAAVGVTIPVELGRADLC